MQKVAQSWLVLTLTNSPFYLGLDAFHEVVARCGCAIIGQTAAEQLFGDQDPIDQIVRVRKVPLTVIGVLILAVASLAWRTVLKIEQKLESYLQIQMECQKHLPEKYVQWEIFNKVFDELKDNRKERWNEYDRHAHDPASGVVIARKQS